MAFCSHPLTNSSTARRAREVRSRGKFRTMISIAARPRAPVAAISSRVCRKPSSTAEPPSICESTSAIADVHVLDGERNALPCQLGGQLIAMRVGAVETGTVAPLAARLALPIAQRCYQFGRFGIFYGQYDCLNRYAP